MLFMYYPFRDEKELLSGSPPRYIAKLAELGVIEVVNQSYSLFEPFAAILDVFERINFDFDNNMDLYDKQDDEVNDDCFEYSDNSDTDTLETTEEQLADLGNINSLTNQVRLVPDNVIIENIRPFKMQQMEVFNFVYKLSRDYMKSLCCKIH